jgi:ATP-dependent helicase/nuclease subunit B
MSWFYRYGLGLRSPTDPEYDPDAWLDASSRGALLHTVYERFCERYRGRQDEIANASARDDVLAIVDSVIQEFRRDVPPPSETVFESECGELRHAALAFLALERESLRRGDTGRWMRLEAAFGDDGQLRFELGDGTSIPVRGRVDRIDELRPRELRVIDYKTGSAWKYTRGDAKGAFNGGRLLQPTIYAHAVEQQLAPDGAPRVLVFEYRFPTARGQNDIARYDRATLALAQPIIRELLEHVTQGTFLPTTDVDDCRFCESAPICRVRTPADGNGYRPPHSPLAAWARANASTFPEYARMLQRRGGADA